MKRKILIPFLALTLILNVTTCGSKPFEPQKTSAEQKTDDDTAEKSVNMGGQQREGKCRRRNRGLGY